MYRNYEFGYGGPPRRRVPDFPFCEPSFHPGFGDPYFRHPIPYGDMGFRGPMRPPMPWPRAPSRRVSDWGTHLINRQIRRTQERILGQGTKKQSKSSNDSPKLASSNASAGQNDETTETPGSENNETKNLDASEGSKLETTDQQQPIAIGPRIPAKQMWENSYREKVLEEREASSLMPPPNADSQNTSGSKNKNKNNRFRRAPYFKRKKKATGANETEDKTENTEDIETFPQMCETCNVQLTGVDQVKSHKESDLHKQNVEKLLTGDNSKVNMALDKLNETVPLPTNTPDCLVWEADTGDRTLNTVRFCRLCSVRMTSLPNAKQHYEGKFHAKRIRIIQRGNRPIRRPFKSTHFISGGVLGIQAKPIQPSYSYSASFVQAEPQLNTAAPIVSIVKPSLPGELVKSVTPSGQYYCPTCNVVIEHAGKLNIHLQSKEHILSKTASY